VRDEEVKSQINVLEKAFRGPVTTAVNKELNRLRRNAVTGDDLLKKLRDAYYQHNMREWADRRSTLLTEKPVTKIVCSEGLV
jgi:hypothetical protein